MQRYMYFFNNSLNQFGIYANINNLSQNINKLRISKKANYHNQCKTNNEN